MGYSNLLLVLLLSSLACVQVYANVYGIVFGFGGQDTQSLVYTVQIDPKTGAFTTVTENFIYVGSAATFDGLSTFDQNQGDFYYTTDFESSFVFSVDTTKGALNPPISTSAVGVSQILWDHGNDQLLVTGEYENDTQIIITVPTTGPSQELFNYSTVDVEYLYSHTLDWKNGIYYVTYETTTTSTFNLGQFSLTTPSDFTSVKFPCANIYTLDIYYDYNLKGLLGVGENPKRETFSYFEIVNGVCTETLIPADLYIVTCSSYDPTTGILYLGFVNNTAPYLGLFDTTKKTLTAVALDTVLTDLEVSYTISKV